VDERRMKMVVLGWEVKEKAGCLGWCRQVMRAVTSGH